LFYFILKIIIIIYTKVIIYKHKHVIHIVILEILILL